MKLLDAFAWLLLVLTTTGVGATLYIWRVWREDQWRPRSTVVGMFLFGAIVAETVAISIAPLVVTYLRRAPVPVWAGDAVLVALIAGIAIPHVYAGFIWLRRRRRG